MHDRPPSQTVWPLKIPLSLHGTTRKGPGIKLSYELAEYCPNLITLFKLENWNNLLWKIQVICPFSASAMLVSSVEIVTHKEVSAGYGKYRKHFFHTYILMSTFFMLLHLKNVFGMRCRQVEVETLSCLFCFSYSISRIFKQSDLRQGYVFHICSLHLFGDVLLFLSIIICPFTKHLLPFKLSFSLSYTYTHPYLVHYHLSIVFIIFNHFNAYLDTYFKFAFPKMYSYKLACVYSFTKLFCCKGIFFFLENKRMGHSPDSALLLFSFFPTSHTVMSATHTLCRRQV